MFTELLHIIYYFTCIHKIGFDEENKINSLVTVAIVKNKIQL